MHQKSFSTLLRYDEKILGITVPLIVQNGELFTEILDAKIDTGSTYCVFSREYADVLGIGDVESGEEIRVESPIGGTATIFGHQLRLTVAGVSVDSLAYFWEDRGKTRNVLGRVGWLQKFRICIVDHDCEFYFSGYNDPED